MLVNETLRQNAELHVTIPAVYEKNSGANEPPKSAEGGFRRGDRVVISNPDDHWHGSEGICGEPLTDRTIIVSVGGHTFRFCVAALRAA